MTVQEKKILCKTPTPGKKGTRIAAWKYDLIHEAIRKCVPKNKKGVAFKELPRLVTRRLSAADRKRLGSVSWYTTTVKLDLEVRGELERIPGSSPQRLHRV